MSYRNPWTENEPSVYASLDACRVYARREISGGNIALELDNCEDQFLAAINTQMPELIGKFVLAIYEGRIERLAHQECGTEQRLPDAEDVAIKFLLQASIERNKVAA